MARHSSSTVMRFTPSSARLSGARKVPLRQSATLSGDHENLMDGSQIKMMVGDEYLLIEDGQKV